MVRRPKLSVRAVAFALVITAGCADKPPRNVASPEPGLIKPGAAKGKGGVIAVSGEIASACKLTFDHVDRAPKFDFDTSELTAADREILDQIAKCVTTGPLKGRGLKLVGRADPRGEVEYNYVLGGHRAGTVERNLSSLGVSKARLVATSRGELDATGSDEAGWQRDRRVDLLLQ